MNSYITSLTSILIKSQNLFFIFLIYKIFQILKRSTNKKILLGEIMNTEKIVEYAIKKGNVELEAYIDINTIDDDEPDVKYRLLPYQAEYAWQMPRNPYKEGGDNWENYEKIIKFEAENWDIISQHLYNFQDETKTVELSGFTLLINPEE